MPTWTVQSITVNPLNAQPGITGIDQFQTSNPGEVMPGTFVTQIWTSDRSTLLVQDPDHGLPPQSGSTAMQFSSSVLPAGPVEVCTSYSDPNQPPTEQWLSVDEPAAGWSQQVFDVLWASNG